MINQYRQIDFHAHILPGVDHGIQSVDESINALHSAYDSGVRRICATSHFYHTNTDIETFIMNRDKAYTKLCEHIDERCPEIVLAAEVMIKEGISDIENIDRLCIGNGKLMLIEMPFASQPDNVFREIHILKAILGIKPVLAHPERYPDDSVNAVIDMGIPLQLESESLVRRFGEQRSRCNRWLKGGYVYAIGSDIHDGYKYDYRQFIKAVAVADKVISK